MPDKPTAADMSAAINLAESAGLSCAMTESRWTFLAWERVPDSPKHLRERFIDVLGILASEHPRAYAIDAWTGRAS